MTGRKTGLGKWVTGFWAVNLLCIAAAGMAWLASVASVPAGATITLAPTIVSLPGATPTPAGAATPGSPPAPTATESWRPTRPAILTPTANPSPQPRGGTIIGRSVARRPIEVFTFGNGPLKRLIVAGIHGGREWNTIRLAELLMEHLRAHPETVPAEVTLYILPNLNPDGEARAHGPAGRVNDHGVDLNRNWPWNWQEDWSRAGCWTLLPVTGGTHAASEPEVAALLSFIQGNDIDALISYHSAALGIFAGGYDYPPSVSLAEAVAEVTTYPWPPIDTGCEMTGDLTDWAAAKRIAAIDIELTNHTSTDFSQNLEVLRVFLEWRR